ncbi:hypothetical protein BH10PLA2_BH10PLA2_01710 [soil metagenome]
MQFDNGGQYRIEIPSVEGPEAFRSVLDQAQSDGVTIHRVSQGSGISLLRDAEILEYARLGEESRVEVCLFIGPRAPWTGESASALAPDGKFFGWRHMTVGTLSAAFDDVQRAVDLGIRSVLVADEGLIFLINEARLSGALPANLIVKASAQLGISNPIGARLLESAGADSLNVPGDAAIQELAGYRSVLANPIDIYVEGPEALGGFTRYHEIGAIVRVSAPVYLKFGLRNAVNLYPSGRHLLEQAKASGAERVRRASIGMEHLARQFPSASVSPSTAKRGIPTSTGIAG